MSIRLGQRDLVEIKVESITLTFARRRFLTDRKIDVALDSPIQGGVNALVLTTDRDRKCKLFRHQLLFAFRRNWTSS